MSTAPPAAVGAPKRRRPITRRSLRLGSGLVLFTYAATHLANHALGLVSLATAEAGLRVAVGIWSSLPGTLLLYGAALIHVALAFLALYERRTLRMPPVEALRYAVGFTIPWFLIGHAIGTRVAVEAFAATPSYRRVVWLISQADNEPRQILLLALVWLHGVLGIHLWLRHRPWFTAWFPALLLVACLVPVLAALGFVAMARELAASADDPLALAALTTLANELGAAQRGALAAWREQWQAGYVIAIGAVLSGRILRDLLARSRNTLVTLTYPGVTVRVPRGFTVLEASRAHGIAHVSLCGGRARCSTCRVEAAPAVHCPSPQRDEARTLARIGAPPGVRLACQLRPTGAVRITPLLAADGSPAPGAQRPVEREIVVLFTDLRRWTGLAENALPFDLVYVQSRFYAAVGDAVAEAGGVPNQFVGDSVMAIFGLDTGVGQACRQALAAVQGIEARMRAANAQLEREFAHALDYGIGLHAGPAVVAMVGWRDTRTFSAVGDTVNIAARLQELTKTYAARLVLSETVARGAGLATTALPAHDIEVRGRRAALRIHAIARTDVLAATGSP